MTQIERRLRIAHFPQIPCKPFYVDVDSLEEAKKIMDTLAFYDLFQYENNIKPDYCNICTLEMWDETEKEWCSWYDEETGIDDINEYFEFIKQEEN